ncbi:DUF5994 family protein [Nocardia puris]|uniref:Uncharacterized protein n=1 Tax=Nocardia puris TaxID=208602 RepID=A0A366DVP3_9NOCA|nr:DUF5994 family protein [Nocardia puris]RBO94156.1 hypothetical protein DFR74_102578 [Nocardia puris]
MTQNRSQDRGGVADRGLGRFHARDDGGQPFDTPTRTPRLLLSDSDEKSGGFDGTWWPRTDNLTSELHDLVAALTTRLGATTRISFDWNSLSLSQRRIDAPDGIEVTGPDPDQPPHVMDVFGPHDRRVRLLVIDPAATADRANAQMREALRDTTSNRHSDDLR